MKKIFITLSCLATIAIVCSSCKSKSSTEETSTEPVKSEIQKKVEEFYYVDLTAPELIANLTENEKKLIPIFIEIAEIVDDLFWKQTFGDKSILDTIQDPYIKDFVSINYGPWERLNNDAPFVTGFGTKPLTCQYYPTDITVEEYEAYTDPNKGSLYTVLRRNEDGSLKTVWYRDEYKAEIDQICTLLDQAIELAENNGLKNYLIERKKAFQTDDYFASDMAWMDMKDSRIDFVVGPIENYDDCFQKAKAAYEAYILLKDEARSEQLTKFIALLPQLQKELPCAPEYKTFVPGSSSDMNVYNAVYYAGDCNSGSKTIAINLPNDDRVAKSKGTRRLQLRNSMQAKYDLIIPAIGNLLFTPEVQEHLKFDAFFWNVTFHEVAHGLGIKQTINGKGSVDKAMGNEVTAWEEAKADILGLFMVCKLVEMGEITDITAEDAIATFMAGIFRSIRFGISKDHGTANMMCLSYMMEQGALTRGTDGIYQIDMTKAKEAINGWANLIITTQGDGNYEFAKEFRAQHNVISAELQSDLDKINAAGIPKDIRFNQGLKVLGLE